MRTLLRKLFEIRPGEEIRAAVMFTYSFLLIASLTIVKPVRTSLFLSQQGPETLPYVFLLIALVTPLFVVLYNKVSKRVRLNRLIAATTIVSIFLFLLAWALLSNEYYAEWFIYAFYVWVTIFGLITTTQFWLLANYVFNAREAKRLFGIIGSGAIAGGILGGYLTTALAPMLHTTGMLHFSSAFLMLCLVLQYTIWKRSARATYSERLRRQGREQQTREDSSPWQLLLQSKLVVYVAAIAGTGVVVGTLIDYQFSVMASERISDSDELTAFFGLWMSNLSIVSFLIQILVTSRVLKAHGVNTALMCLPVVTIVGAGAVVFMPSLLAASALKVGEGGLKQSLHKAAFELLGLPVPAHLKNRVKALIDVAIDNLATGLAGVIILLLLFFDISSARELSAIIICLGIGWVYLIYRSRTDYLNAFRQAIEKRAIRPEDLSYEIYSSLRADHLIELLQSKNERQIVLALGYLENMGDKRLADQLTVLAESASDEVLRRVFRLARTIPSIDLSVQAARLIVSGHPDIRVSAMRYLLRRSSNKLELIQLYLTSEDEIIQAAAIISAAKEWAGDDEFREVVDISALLESLCSRIQFGEAPRGFRLAMAEALSIAPQRELDYCVEILLNSADVQIASRAALSAARTRDERFVGTLIQQLENPATRKSAREALSEYGEAIAERLAALLDDPEARFKIRFEIPRVLSMIGTQKCFALLAEYLSASNARLRYEVIRAMNRMRTRDKGLKVKTRTLEPVIRAEIRSYYLMVQVLNRIENSELAKQIEIHSIQENTARKLLIRAMNEKLSGCLERIFRLLGLRHAPRDIYHAYLGVTSGVPDLRANAVELLELMLQPRMKASLLPLAECLEQRELIDIGKALFDINIANEAAGLAILLHGDDDWLRTTALHMLWYVEHPSRFPDIEILASHESFVVRETASRAKRDFVVSFVN